MRWIVWGQHAEKDYRGEHVMVSHIIGEIEGPADRFRAYPLAVRRFGGAVDHVQSALSHEVSVRERASLHSVRRFARCRPR